MKEMEGYEHSTTTDREISNLETNEPRTIQEGKAAVSSNSSFTRRPSKPSGKLEQRTSGVV